MVILPNLYDHQMSQKDAAKTALRTHRAVIMAAPPGTGKCLGRGTPVMLYSGEVVPVEHVETSDYLMGPDSSPREVLTCSSGRGPLYRVTPSKGDPYVVNDAHILTLRMNSDCCGWRSGDLVDVTVRDYLSSSSDFRHHAKGFRADVDFPWINEPPIDPYVVGVWLGDGCRRDMTITLSDEDKRWIIPSLQQVADSLNLRLAPSVERGRCERFTLTAGRRNTQLGAGAFKQAMRSMGLGKEKFIPNCIKVGSREVRLGVLAGLIDTDGSRLPAGGYDFITKDERLAHDIAFVCRSLGLSAYVSKCSKGIKSSGFVGDYYRMTISGHTDMIPCRVERKKSLPRKMNKDVRNVGIAVTPIGDGDWFGFEIDGDGRFLLGDFTVTHNTRMAKWILGSSLNRHPADGESGHSLFCVHRRGLVENASDSFSEEPKLPHGVLMSGHEPETYRRVQVASIDTLLSWFVTEKRWTSTMTFDLVAFDECHSHFPKLKALLDVQDVRRSELGLKPTFVLGLSATPAAKGLADLFGAIVPGPKTQWLIDQGYLSPFRYFRATQGNLDALVKSSSSDGYTKDSVCEAMKGLSGDLVRDWRKIAEGRATVGFFPRLDQARQAQQVLIDAGIDAEYVDGQTDDEERRRLFRALNNGVIQYLCNVGVIERGTDIPRVQCVQLCTAIGTRERYLQMIGRGSRVHPEKKDCLVLDHGGNVQRHGFFEDDIAWTLDMSRAKECPLNDRPTMECPRCHEIYRGGKCRECGYEPTQKERKAQGLEFDGSELKEIVRSTAPKSLKSAEQLMIIALYKAGKSNRTFQQALGMAYGMAREQGTVFKVPKLVMVGGNAYKMVPYKSPDAPRKVKVLYPFTNGGGHGGPYIVKMPNRSYSAPY